MIMFAIIQGLYILREDEEEDIERQKRETITGKEKTTGAAGRRTSIKWNKVFSGSFVGRSKKKA